MVPSILASHKAGPDHHIRTPMLYHHYDFVLLIYCGSFALNIMVHKPFEIVLFLSY